MRWWGGCRWIDEDTEPLPRTIYHRSKLQAEALAAAATGLQRARAAHGPLLPGAERMAMFRLHRGIDARDVASAHAALLLDEAAFARYIACAATPFRREDCLELATQPRNVLARRAPQLLAEFERRGWPLPLSIDRVYDSARIRRSWVAAAFRAGRVLQQYAAGSIEVLPRGVDQGPRGRIGDAGAGS
jgi:nucleoside-diphosphate-sugar epimerase